MPDLEDFSRVVSSIHAAALVDGGWVRPLAEIRRTVDAVACGLLVSENGDRAAYYCTAAREGYCTVARQGQALLGLQSHSELDTAELDTAELDTAELDTAELDTDWMKPHELGDGLIVRLTEGPEPTCLLVAAPQHADPSADTDRAHFINALVPHWKQAVRTHERLHAPRPGYEIAGLIDSVRHALVIVDRDFSIVHMNRSAARILRGHDGLRSRESILEATRPQTNSESQIRIEQAVHCGTRGFRSGATLTCRRPSGRRPFVIHILPLDRETTAGRDGPALLCVVDPDAKVCPATELVRNVFGMTRAEAEVAVRVVNGDGIKPISEELSLSVATVKSHLQHVFDKTETHRQAELVRLLLTISPLVGSD